MLHCYSEELVRYPNDLTGIMDLNSSCYDYDAHDPGPSLRDCTIGPIATPNCSNRHRVACRRTLENLHRPQCC
jgi:hypothetical protein